MTHRILLADADAFFVGVARLVDPEGAGRAKLLIVGGTRESRGVVTSASYEARKFGVRSAMSIARALKLCPDAMCVPVPSKACGVKSREIRAVLERLAPRVEGASVDEWYMDLTGTEAVYKNELLGETAHRIRAAVKTETGMSISIGGGTNRLIAKLAVERAKPKPGTGADGVHIVKPGDEEAFVRTLMLADIPMVGPKFQERLASFGMRTVPDAIERGLPTLRMLLGERAGGWLWDRIHGISETEVRTHDLQKSMSRDETFPRDLHDDADLRRELLRLVTRAANDLRSDGLTTRTVTVRLRDKDFKTRSARTTLNAPVVSDRVIYKVACELLDKLRAARRVPARLIGVALSSLEDDPRADQLRLVVDSDPLSESDRDRALARSIDKVRNKFGSKGIIPATLSQR
jgi:DNA polymerase-4